MEKKVYLQVRKSWQLSRPRNPQLWHLAIDLAILAATLGWFAYFRQSSWKILTGFGVTVLMFRSFAVMHDAVHGAIQSRSNDWFGVFYGGIALLAFEPWKSSHMEHHYWSGNAERDPVMGFVLLYPRLPAWFKFVLTLAWRCWIPVLSTLQHIVFWILSMQKFKASVRRSKMFASMLWPFIFWASLLIFLPHDALWSALLPGLVLYLLATEFVNLPHHLRLPALSGNERLPVWQQYRTARSCVYPKWLARYVTLNFNYHAEHHMFPDLAWYHLESVHKILTQDLQLELHTDQQFAWTLQHRQHDLQFVLERIGKEKIEIQKPA